MTIKCFLILLVPLPRYESREWPRSPVIPRSRWPPSEADEENHRREFQNLAFSEALQMEKLLNKQSPEVTRSRRPFEAEARDWPPSDAESDRRDFHDLAFSEALKMEDLLNKQLEKIYPYNKETTTSIHSHPDLHGLEEQRSKINFLPKPFPARNIDNESPQIKLNFPDPISSQNFDEATKDWTQVNPFYLPQAELHVQPSVSEGFAVETRHKDNVVEEANLQSSLGEQIRPWPTFLNVDVNAKSRRNETPAKENLFNLSPSDVRQLENINETRTKSLGQIESRKNVPIIDSQLINASGQKSLEGKISEKNTTNTEGIVNDGRKDKTTFSQKDVKVRKSRFDNGKDSENKGSSNSKDFNDVEKNKVREIEARKGQKDWKVNESRRSHSSEVLERLKKWEESANRTYDKKRKTISTSVAIPQKLSSAPLTNTPLLNPEMRQETSASSLASRGTESQAQTSSSEWRNKTESFLLSIGAVPKVGADQSNPVRHQPQQQQPQQHQSRQHRSQQHQSLQHQSPQRQSLQKQPQQHQSPQHWSQQRQSPQRQSPQRQSPQRQSPQRQSPQKQPQQHQSRQHQSQQYQSRHHQSPQRQSPQKQPQQHQSPQRQSPQKQPQQHQSPQHRSQQYQSPQHWSRQRQSPQKQSLQEQAQEIEYRPLDDGCVCCSSTKHSLDWCPTFVNLPLDERWSIVRQLVKFCPKCLSGNHNFEECLARPNSSHRFTCCDRYHDLLHKCALNQDKKVFMLMFPPPRLVMGSFFGLIYLHGDLQGDIFSLPDKNPT